MPAPGELGGFLFCEKGGTELASNLFQMYNVDVYVCVISLLFIIFLFRFHVKILHFW